MIIGLGLGVLASSHFVVTAEAEVLRGKKSVTAFGNAQVDTAQSKFGGASALFDGTGDYLFSPSNADFGFGTGDFTIEGWIRFNNFTNGPVFVDMRAAGGNEAKPVIYFTTDGTINYYVSGANRITGSAQSTGVWYHVAVSRSGTSTKLFVNGTQTGSTWSDNTNYSATVLSLGIASWNTAFNAHNGWMDEFRISNTARYTANFTAPTEPFVNDANTLLLLHMDGTDASTYFEDDNGVRSKKGVTAIGNAQVDTAQSKFGGASALFDGNDDYLNCPVFNNFSTSNFTLEFWFRTNAKTRPYPALLSNYLDASFTTDSWLFSDRHDSFNTKLTFWAYNINSSNPVLTSTTTISNGTWYHVAVVRNGTNFKLYLNGSEDASATSSASLDGSTIKSLFVGRADTQNTSFDGHIDEVRISNTARYTANFTPSTTPFVNDANTLLLLHMDGTDGSTVFTDDNSILTVSPNANASNVNEGSSLTFNVSTVDVQNQTLYWTVTNSGDFSTNSGSFSLTNNAGSFSVTPTEDLATEGAETFQAEVRLENTSGPIVATSPSIIINDTSLTPSPWTTYTSSSFTVGQYAVGNGNITVHGIVNTNQLVGSMVYVESSGGAPLQNKLRGFVLDLSSGAINLGSTVDLGVVGDFGGSWYTGAVAGNGNTGVAIYITSSSYYTQVRGFTISNYSSCNQSTAPTFTLGATDNMFTGGNTLGQGTMVTYVGNNNRYVCTTRGNDSGRRRSYTWNGTSLTADSAIYQMGGNGANFSRGIVFANPGSSLLYGAHHLTSDANGNYVNMIQFSSNTVADGGTSEFYSIGESGVTTRGCVINDVAGANRSMIFATAGSETGITARIATTTSFTSTTGTTYGTAAFSSSISNNSNFQPAKNPYADEVFLFYKNTSTALSVWPVTYSGTTPTFSGTQTTNIATDLANGGQIPMFPYYNATYGAWYLFLSTGSGAVGKVHAIKYTPI